MEIPYHGKISTSNMAFNQQHKTYKMVTNNLTYKWVETMTTTKKSFNTVVKYQWDIASLETTGLENQTKLQTYFPLPPLPPHQEGLIDGFESRNEGCRVTCELLIA